MNKLIGLNELKLGQKAKVLKVICEGSIRRRLQDMGLVEGCIVQAIYKSIFGDPTAFIISDCIIAIRNDDSKNVIVTCDR